MLSAPPMSIEPVISARLRAALAEFANRMRPVVTCWESTGEAACIASLADLIETARCIYRFVLVSGGSDAPVDQLIDVVRGQVIILARELDRVYLRNARRASKPDSIARTAILALLTALTEIEDDTLDDDRVAAIE